MQLIICEKPKVAEKIAFALADDGKPQRQVQNGVAYYRLNRRGNEIAVVPAVGHVYSLNEKVRTSSYPVFDISWQPSYQVDKASEYTRAYIKNIEQLSQGADEIISACDYDIEGSLIGYNAIRFACKVKDMKQGKRMKFSALTSDDLAEAYENRAALDVENAQAGEARHMLDWFYGINLSRALMSAIRRRGIYKIMSIGRVQGPALSILVKKEKEIAAFKPTPYWQIFGTCKKVRFSHAKDRFAVEQEAKKALEESREESTVEGIEKKEFAQPAPNPYDLTSLQVEAYKQFKFNPSLTLELAQTLYEASMISYPRTSSQKLPEKLNLAKIIGQLQRQQAYAALAGKLVQEKRFKPNEGKKDDPAHPAIHPTGQQGGMGEREGKLYDLIVRRFLATFAPAAKRESQKVTLLSGTQKYVTSGNRTLVQGWFEYYLPYLKLDETTLPDFAKGEKVLLAGLKLEQKMTQPPKRYTPASIIAELERLELGTKATRSVIIDTLSKRGYIEGKGSLEATPFGLSVYENLKKNVSEILDEELTRTIEVEIEKIQNRELDQKKVVEDGKRVLEKIIKEFKGHEDQVGLELVQGFRKKEHEQSLLGKCNKCADGTLRVIPTSAGKQFVGCTNYPNCKNIFPLPGQAKIENLNALCEKCSTPRVRVIRAARKPFEMCLDPSCETKKNWGRPQAIVQAVQNQQAAISQGQAQPQNRQAGQTSSGIATNTGQAQAPKATFDQNMPQAKSGIFVPDAPAAQKSAQKKPPRKKTAKAGNEKKA